MDNDKLKKIRQSYLKAEGVSEDEASKPKKKLFQSSDKEAIKDEEKAELVEEPKLKDKITQSIVRLLKRRGPPENIKKD